MSEHDDKAKGAMNKAAGAAKDKLGDATAVRAVAKKLPKASRASVPRGRLQYNFMEAAEYAYLPKSAECHFGRLVLEGPSV